MKKCPRSRHTVEMALSVFPFVIAILFIVGCGRRGVGDYMAAGDQAMQNTRLAEAESDYQQA
ncbi:MAG TPA: hypothetical protein VJ728_12905, partial [Candidatus Binataceae bacterium]|nr:hypothetical protein [Candidatus Binataceae bacterium]